MPVPSEVASGEDVTLTNSEPQGGDPNDPPRNDPPRNDSSDSNDSSGNPGATPEDENPPRGELDMLGKEHLSSLFSSPMFVSISSSIVMPTAFLFIQSYQHKLETNLSLHSSSPEAFFCITKQDLILKQLEAGWPCGALTLADKTVLRLLMDFEHENKAQIMQDCLSINPDGTINGLETLKLLSNLYRLVPDQGFMYLIERISVIDKIYDAVNYFGSFFG